MFTSTCKTRIVLRCCYFSRICIFFLLNFSLACSFLLFSSLLFSALLFSSLLFPPLLLHLSILSAKLPSVRYVHILQEELAANNADTNIFQVIIEDSARNSALLRRMVWKSHVDYYSFILLHIQMSTGIRHVQYCWSPHKLRLPTQGRD